MPKLNANPIQNPESTYNFELLSGCKFFQRIAKSSFSSDRRIKMHQTITNCQNSCSSNKNYKVDSVAERIAAAFLIA